MRIKLTGTFGPGAGCEKEIGAGETVRVGRSRRKSEIAAPKDEYLSGVHFSIECTAAECMIRNHSPNGTTLTGVPVTEARPLADGDLIAAGHSQFMVRFTSAPLPELLRKQALPLYAVLDAAREQRIPAFLQQGSAQYQSLYEGERGEALSSVAPYLVALSPASGLTDALATHAWGKSWGVFLLSRMPFAEIRKHLRHFLLVQSENGKRMVFRFYDPRVLRVFLPTCLPQECAQFFGGLDGFLVEASEMKFALRFRLSSEGLVQEEVQLES